MQLRDMKPGQRGVVKGFCRETLNIGKNSFLWASFPTLVLKSPGWPR